MIKPILHSLPFFVMICWAGCAFVGSSAVYLKQALNQDTVTTYNTSNNSVNAPTSSAIVKRKIVYVTTDPTDIEQSRWYVFATDETNQLRSYRLVNPLIKVEPFLEESSYVEFVNTTDPFKWNPVIHLKSFEDVRLVNPLHH